LAILELCGWIEQSMDDLILKNAKKYLENKANFDFVKAEVVKRTYSFDYNNHFRKMLMNIIGIINVERLEKKLDKSKFIPLEANLRRLKKCRDNEAHTHIKNTTKSLDAPSATIRNFQIVYDGLKDIQYKLKKIKI